MVTTIELPEPFASIPRATLTFGPSPIQALPNISKALGGKVNVQRVSDCMLSWSYYVRYWSSCEHYYRLILMPHLFHGILGYHYQVLSRLPFTPLLLLAGAMCGVTFRIENDSLSPNTLFYSTAWTFTVLTQVTTLKSENACLGVRLVCVLPM